LKDYPYLENSRNLPFRRKVRFGETPKPARETRALPIHVNLSAFFRELFRLRRSPAYGFGRRGDLRHDNRR